MWSNWILQVRVKTDIVTLENTLTSSCKTEHWHQFSSVAQSCPTLCDPMNRSTLGLPVHHQLPEFTQTHVHWVGDATQASHPLSSPSPPAPNPSQQAGFKKGRGTRDQIANIRWIIEKAREFQKNIYFCFIDYAKTFDCVDHNKLWEILKEMGIPDHLTCPLRNLYEVRKQ